MYRLLGKHTKINPAQNFYDARPDRKWRGKEDEKHLEKIKESIARVKAMDTTDFVFIALNYASQTSTNRLCRLYLVLSGTCAFFLFALNSVNLANLAKIIVVAISPV